MFCLILIRSYNGEFYGKNRFLRPEMDGRRGRRRRERDRANGMDERNPYGSKGGYVTSSKRGRDRAMDGRDYHPEYDSRYDSRYDANYGASNGHYGLNNIENIIDLLNMKFMEK